ncbi:MAG: PqiC family protein [gamma proteobacterium symbiont of Bathyaustriella thionipta]|nr:PqiC family protein [gamma proteobacterium symbiont of Bathyaustriella thionipta]
MLLRTMVLLMAASLLLNGCGRPTPPSRFFMLNPVAVPSADTIAGQKVLLGISPLTVAPYIDRSQMVIRSSENQLSLSELDKWAEPLEDNIAQVIVTNLNRSLPAVQAFVDAHRRLPTKYRINIRILRFDSDEQGHVRLQAQWSLLDMDGQDEQYLSFNEAAIRVQASSGSPADIAIGMSEAIGQLSEQMAKKLSPLLLKQ